MRVSSAICTIQGRNNVVNDNGKQNHTHARLATTSTTTLSLKKRTKF